jgi:septal ring factor EnvC (AmiA/AmiB activator)
MTTTSNTDLQQLKEFISDRFNQLDRKIDTVKSELKQEITEIKSELKQEIADVRGDIKAIDARIKNVETAVQQIPTLSEKFGELKNWRQIAFIIIAAVVGWFARSGKM